MVRVCDLNETTISKALDAGAVGIQVAQVASVDDVVAAIKASIYYRLVERGVCRFVRAAKYSATDNDLFQEGK